MGKKTLLRGDVCQYEKEQKAAKTILASTLFSFSFPYSFPEGTEIAMGNDLFGLICGYSISHNFPCNAIQIRSCMS